MVRDFNHHLVAMTHDFSMLRDNGYKKIFCIAIEEFENIANTAECLLFNDVSLFGEWIPNR
jgi:RNA recognition motif-containing protein